MSEAAVLGAVRAAVNVLPGVRLWRNNSGVGTGLCHAGVVRYGLGEGSADLVGVCRVTYPGALLWCGRFFAIEVKSQRGRVSPEQAAWARAVRELGGFVAVVRSVEEALAAVERCRRGENS